MKTRNYFSAALLLIALSGASYAWNCGTCDYYQTWHTSAVAFTPSFSSSYALDGGNYVVCPGCSMSLRNIGAYYSDGSCGSTGTIVSNLLAFTYKSGSMLSRTSNGLNTYYTREQIAASSCGADTNPNPSYMWGYLTSVPNSMGVYTFSQNGTYQVYVDFEKTICCNYAGGWKFFICSWSGGCWVAQTAYNIIVPAPATTVSAKSADIPDAGPSTVYHLYWNVTNTGIGKEKISFTRNCGTWSCSFSGYTEGTQVTVNEGSSYAVFMDVTTPSSMASANVGVTITYDDGYGLSCISSANTISLVNVTVAGCPVNSLRITPPKNIFDPEHGMVLLNWSIRNNGSKDLELDIAKVCLSNPNKCNFTGTEAGQSTITRSLAVGSTAIISLNSSVGRVMSDRIGLNITYDDEDGLSCSNQSNIYSYVNVTIPFKA